MAGAKRQLSSEGAAHVPKAGWTYVHLGVEIGHRLVICRKPVDLNTIGRQFLHDLEEGVWVDGQSLQ